VPLVKAAKRAILLSGTPALSRPPELLTQLQALLPQAGITKAAFEERYTKTHRFHGSQVTSARLMSPCHAWWSYSYHSMMPAPWLLQPLLLPLTIVLPFKFLAAHCQLSAVVAGSFRQIVSWANTACLQ